MKQSALLEFQSSAFAVEPGEDSHTNPGIHGKSLATWLAEQLRTKGLGVGQVVAEDFGWCIPVESKPHKLFVVCASTEEKENAWRVFAFAEGGFVARMLGKDQSAQAVTSLYAAVKEVLLSSLHVHGLREDAP